MGKIVSRSAGLQVNINCNQTIRKVTTMEGKSNYAFLK